MRLPVQPLKVDRAPVAISDEGGAFSFGADIDVSTGRHREEVPVVVRDGHRLFGGGDASDDTAEVGELDHHVLLEA